MNHYYNENDPHAAAWLNGLISEGLIPNGVVDTRSIVDVQPADLAGFTQCHFFAGIAGWVLALQLAGWPSDRPVWTGSCPCQPFSTIGKGKGKEDERDLWPDFFRLIRQCKPAHVFGEQVENAIGHGWLDRICADLEGEDYACGDVVLGAHSVGAPQKRQRLYWMADSDKERWNRVNSLLREEERGREPGDFPKTSGGGENRWMGNSEGNRERRDGESDQGRECQVKTGGRGIQCGGMEHSIVSGLEGYAGNGDYGDESRRLTEDEAGPTTETGFWSDSRWIDCRGGKTRRIPVESSLFPLASRLPYKLARRRSISTAILSGSGNSIVPQVAAEFIRAYMEITK